MTEPLFWLGCSLLLVAVALTALLVVALPVLQEVSRAAHSAEKLFDKLTQELPPTLEALRQTGADLGDLADELSDGVHRASRVVKQVDEGLQTTQKQVQAVGITTRSLWSGVGTAWRVFTRPSATAPPRQSPVAPSPQDTPALKPAVAVQDRLSENGGAAPTLTSPAEPPRGESPSDAAPPLPLSTPQPADVEP